MNDNETKMTLELGPSTPLQRCQVEPSPTSTLELFAKAVNG